MPTSIEWTNETWNPTTGCDRVSPGCAHCYAMTLAKRLKGMGQPRYQKDGGRASGPGFGLTLHEDALTKPLSWKKPRRVFVNSMSDLFHEDVPFEFIYSVFITMAQTPQHTYQILTKRPERMRDFCRRIRYIATDELAHLKAPGVSFWPNDPTGYEARPLPNVWLGVTVENQHFADERIPVLLDTPAAVRFLSCEPLLEAVALKPEWLLGKRITCTDYNPTSCEGRCSGVGEDCKAVYAGQPSLSWVIVGGESGPHHRPFDPDWARSLVQQCREAGVAAFVKQLGGLRPGNRLGDLPEDLRVRKFPR